MSGIQVEIPRTEIEAIAREVFDSMTAASGPADAKAAETQQAIARILAKQFITIAELEILLNCSRGYIGKLVDQASTEGCKHPLPYCDLNGLIMFEPAAVMEWARARKPLQKKTRKQGGKKPRYPREIKQAANA